MTSRVEAEWLHRSSPEGTAEIPTRDQGGMGTYFYASLRQSNDFQLETGVLAGAQGTPFASPATGKEHPQERQHSAAEGGRAGPSAPGKGYIIF